jgi:hypothetical protein
MNTLEILIWAGIAAAVGIVLGALVVFSLRSIIKTAIKEAYWELQEELKEELKAVERRHSNPSPGEKKETGSDTQR